MDNSIQKIKKDKAEKYFILFLVLMGIESICCFLLLLLSKSDPKNQLILGLSLYRLIMMGIPGLILIFIIIILCKRSFLDRILNYMQKPKEINRYKDVVINLIGIVSAGIFLYFGFFNPDRFFVIYSRISTILLFLILISFQFLFAEDVMRYSYIKRDGRKTINYYRTEFITWFLAGFTFYILIRLTKIGLTPDPLDWQPNGMSIQYWEVAASLLISYAVVSFSRDFLYKIPGKILTLLAFLLLWSFGAILWISVPTDEVLKNSYFMEISAPDNLPYPASDAAYFGLWSETIAAGFGFKNSVISRQLFVVLLAFAQMLSKGNILKEINLLTLFIALFPAILFTIGNRLHSPAAGFITAILAIFREWNTLYMAPYFGVSDSKMFLSDLPALLFFLIFLDFFIQWFKSPKSFIKAVLTGGSLALIGLIRSQFLLLFPFLGLFYLVKKELTHKEKILPLFAFCFTLFLTLLPCLSRSIKLTNSLMLEDSNIHSSELARRYSDDPNFSMEKEPDESDEEYNLREQKHILSFTFSKPLYVIHFITNHFIKDQIDSFLVLPIGLRYDMNINDRTSSDYQAVDKRFNLKTYCFERLLFGLLIVLGITACCKANGFAGAIPLVICLINMGITSLGRYSGWRFILPSDWICYFYFSCGISELFQILCRADSPSKMDRQEFVETGNLKSNHLFCWTTIILQLFFLCIGLLPVTVKYIIPRRIEEKSNSEIVNKIENLSIQYGNEYEKLLKKVDQEDLVLINGKIIYPRWFAAGSGLTSANPWKVYETRNFNRLCFIVLNENNYEVILPQSEIPLIHLHGHEVLAAGKLSDQGYFDSEFIIIEDQFNSDGSPLVLVSDSFKLQ